MHSVISTNLRRLYFVTVTAILRLLCRRASKDFDKSLFHPEQTQQKLYRRLVKKLSQTEYGIHYGISSDENYNSFCNKLPVQCYDDIAPWINRQLSGKRAVITPDRVIHIEPTSGSSGAKKPIPYTQGLRHSFSKMFRIWAYDLLHYGPGFNSAKLFISVSPTMDTDGFQNDIEYLDQPLRFLLAPFLVSPPKTSSEDFLHELAMTLLRTKDLEIISVWSPSYLLNVLNYIQDNRKRLAPLLETSIAEHLTKDILNWNRLWPQLKFISCWDSALSESLAGQIRQNFPDVLVQGKGLLATEAPITIPLTGITGTVPLITEVFLEFETSSGEIKRLHELQFGESYQLIISQLAGLTRYRLGDMVEVAGSLRNTPTLRFMGRANQVCDLVGEKLNELFVYEALQPLLADSVFILVPQQSGYILLTETASDALAQKAEQALCQAHHYALARRQAQLIALKVIVVSDLLSNLQSFYQDQGIKAGDIKHTALITDPEQGLQLLTRCRNN